MKKQVLSSNQEEPLFEKQLFSSDPTSAVKIFSDVDVAQVFELLQKMTHLYTRKKHVMTSTDIKSLSWGFLKIGELVEAEELARSIPNEEIRSQAICNVIDKYAAFGRVEEAKRLVKSIPSTHYRQSAPQRIVKELLEAYHFEKAERFSREEGVRYNLNVCYWFVLNHARANHFEEAMQLVKNIPDKLTKAQAMKGIVLYLLNAHHVKEAEQLAKDIPDKIERSHAIAGIANFHHRANNFEEAIRLSRAVPDKEIQSKSFLEIIITLSSDNNHNIKKTKKLEQLAKEIPNEKRRSSALAFIVYSALDLKEAGRLSRSIPDNEERSNVMCHVAYKYLDVGNFDEAEKLARDIPDKRRGLHLIQSVDRRRQSAS